MNFCSFNFIPLGHITAFVCYLRYEKKLKWGKKPNYLQTTSLADKSEIKLKIHWRKITFPEELYEGPAAGWPCNQLCLARPGILAKLLLVGKLLQSSFLQTKVFPVKLSVTVTANMFEKKIKMHTIIAGIHPIFFPLPFIFFLHLTRLRCV